MRFDIDFLFLFIVYSPLEGIQSGFSHTQRRSSHEKSNRSPEAKSQRLRMHRRQRRRPHLKRFAHWSFGQKWRYTWKRSRSSWRLLIAHSANPRTRQYVTSTCSRSSLSRPSPKGWLFISLNLPILPCATSCA